MKDIVLLYIAYGVGGALCTIKLWLMLRAYWISRRMRTNYEEQPLHKRKEIEEQFIRDPRVAAYTKPVPTHLMLIYVLIAFAFVALVLYLGRP